MQKGWKEAVGINKDHLILRVTSLKMRTVFMNMQGFQYMKLKQPVGYQSREIVVLYAKWERFLACHLFLQTNVLQLYPG